MPKWWKSLRAILILVPMMSAGVAHAALIDFGTYTRDTESGLDWLDVTQTQGMSYDAVTLALSSTLAGWSYARGTQLEELLNHAGGTPPYTGYSAVNNGVADPLTALLGRTTETRQVRQTHGLLADPLAEYQWVGVIYDCTGFGTCATEDYIDVFGQTQLPDEPSEYIGSFLVRESPDTVPEPGTIGLLGLGVLGLIGRFRRIR